MNAKVWKSECAGTTAWHARLTLGRVQVAYAVYRHRYSAGSDRWVFQPSLVYDRAREQA